MNNIRVTTETLVTANQGECLTTVSDRLETKSRQLVIPGFYIYLPVKTMAQSLIFVFRYKNVHCVHVGSNLCFDYL